MTTARPVPAALLAILPSLCCLVLIGGCSTGPAGRGAVADIPPSIELPDSLGLEPFQELPPAERAARVDLAAALAARACGSRDGEERERGLGAAVGTNPAEPAHWLALAQTRRWLGDLAGAGTARDAGLAALDNAAPENRQEMARELCLLGAWICYDGARWEEGLRWADRALGRDAGLAGHLIKGLLLSMTFRQNESAAKRERECFRPLDYGTNRPHNYRWLERMAQMRSAIRYPNPGLIGILRRPPKFEEHNVERWRDHGLLSEWNEDWEGANRFYEESFAALPVNEGTWVRRRQRRLEIQNRTDQPLLFWTSRQGRYVTGSLLAYTGDLFLQMRAAPPESEERRSLARLVVEYATNAELRTTNVPWTNMWRGAGYMEIGSYRNAWNDLTMAESQFEQLTIEEPLLVPLIGHLLCLWEKPRQARSYVERAVSFYPEDAQCWTDLGYILVLNEELDAAHQALSRAIALDAGLAAAWYNRGLMHFHAHRWGPAVDDLTEAARLAPGSEDVMSLLQRAAQVLQREGPGPAD
jgi:hypothetical protein